MPYTPFQFRDSLFKTEEIKLEMTLCKPDYNRTELALITTSYDVEYTEKFGDVNVLTFNIPRVVDGANNDEYDVMKGEYVIKLNFNDTISYFIIDQADRTVSKGKTYKKVTAYSYEYIFSNKVIRRWSEGQQSLTYVMDYVFTLFPSWTYGSTDIDLMTKERTLDIDEKTVLDFLFEVQKSFTAVFVFDTVNRQIDIVELVNVGQDKGFVLSETNYADKIEIKPEYKEMVTRLKPYGYDDLDIRGVSPTGLGYIDNLDYFIAGFTRSGTTTLTSSEFMSDGLCHGLLDLQDEITTQSSNISTERANLSTLEGELNDLLFKPDAPKGLNVLKTELETIQLQIDAAIRIGTTDLSALKSQQTAKEGEIATRQGEVDSKNSAITSSKALLQTYSDALDLPNFLTADEIKELDAFILEGTWQDDSYTVASDLLADAQDMLATLSQPKINFEVDSINFLNSLDRSIDWEYITAGVGDLITIDVESSNLVFTVRLVEFKYSKKGANLNLKFTNKGKFDDPAVYLRDLLKQSSATSATLRIKAVGYNAYSEDKSTISDYIDNALDLAQQQAFAGVNQEVIIDDRGIQLVNTTNTDKQLKMIGDLIVFTSDGWNTSGLALSSSGIYAQSVYGKLIAGASLQIETTDGSFIVDNNGVQIRNSVLTFVNDLDQPEGILETLLNTDVQSKLNYVLNDNFVTATEASNLTVLLNKVKAERVQLLSDATRLTLTGDTQWTNYNTAVNDLDTYLTTNIVGQGTYPIDLVTEGLTRADISTKFDDCDGYKKVFETYLIQKEASLVESDPVGNLLNDTTISGTLDNWSTDASLTVAQKLFYGVNVDVQQIYTDGDIEIKSTKIDVNPNRVYVCTMYMLSDSANGTDHIGMFGYDDTDTLRTLKRYLASDGSYVDDVTDGKVWSGDNPVDNASGTDWEKRVFYILPSTADPTKYYSLNANVTHFIVMPTDCTKLEIRWANYLNASTFKNSWLAFPSLIETDTSTLDRMFDIFIQEEKKYNGVTIDATNGIQVFTDDVPVSGTIRTLLNATDGIKISHYNGSSWDDKFWVDSGTGNLIANDIVAENIQINTGLIKNNSGNTMINLNTGEINFDEVTFAGTMTAPTIQSGLIKTLDGSTLIDLTTGAINFNSSSFDNASITELTVDKLNTTDAIRNYKNYELHNISRTASQADINFIDIEDQNIVFQRGQYVGDLQPSSYQQWLDHVQSHLTTASQPNQLITTDNPPKIYYFTGDLYLTGGNLVHSDASYKSYEFSEQFQTWLTGGTIYNTSLGSAILTKIAELNCTIYTNNNLDEVYMYATVPKNLPTIQEWDSYPDSPDLTTLHPYQIICTDDGYTRLYTSSESMYIKHTAHSTPQGYIWARAGATYSYYHLDGGSWDAHQTNVTASGDTQINDTDSYIETNFDIESFDYLMNSEGIILARTTDFDADLGVKVHVTNRNGDKLFWTDATRKAYSTTTTSLPVYTWRYDYNNRLKMYFDDTHQDFIPKFELGTGVGNEQNPEYGRGYIYKDADGVQLQYIKSAGGAVTLTLGENGIEGDFAGAKLLEQLDVYTDGMIVKWENLAAKKFDLTFDGSGYIATITDQDTSEVIYINQHATTMP